ncbi:DUF541 domain-containing protein [Filobacillus milosensis]|uniref:DUF541 domain-containing protein n=1 Tax=Filobacillus milosensis TaxID=94137 RepID=A0A4Y8IMY9_9BACI|nr:SIMPL domain-containing protein [Filobacillus milosensis]TFB21359.1 DUF541 domain-containing protein [Filobacillus milosensis]
MKKTVLKTLGLAGALVLAGLFFQNFMSESTQQDEGIAHADEDRSLGTIVVNGEGEVTAEPDLAVLRLGFEATKDSADEAQSTVSKQMESIKKALIDHGVDKESFETVRFHVYPYKHYEKEVEKFRAQHIISFETSEIDKVGDLLDVASKAGANIVEPVRFSLEDPTELEHQALQKAIEKTKGKAEAMAKTAGKSKGEVLQISEQGAHINMPVQNYSEEMAMDQAESSSKTVIEAGEVRVVQRVTVVYKLD